MGVPRHGPYYIYYYFSNAHPIFCIIHYLGFSKIIFSMILIKYQLVHVNTTTILYLYHGQTLAMNDFQTRQYITMGHSVRLSPLFPLKED